MSEHEHCISPSLSNGFCWHTFEIPHWHQCRKHCARRAQEEQFDLPLFQQLKGPIPACRQCEVKTCGQVCADCAREPFLICRFHNAWPRVKFCHCIPANGYAGQVSELAAGGAGWLSVTLVLLTNIWPVKQTSIISLTWPVTSTNALNIRW